MLFSVRKIDLSPFSLGLSPDEAAFVELKLRLANGLRQSRVRGNITQVRLAKSVGSSQSRVAKMEAGDPTVSMDLLVRSLLTLGATPLELGRMLAGAKTTTRAFKPAALRSVAYFASLACILLRVDVP